MKTSPPRWYRGPTNPGCGTRSCGFRFNNRDASDPKISSGFDVRIRRQSHAALSRMPHSLYLQLDAQARAERPRTIPVIGSVTRIDEESAIAEIDLRYRMKELTRGRTSACPEEDVVWARGVDGDCEVAKRFMP